jgi:hypothetical protein
MSRNVYKTNLCEDKTELSNNVRMLRDRYCICTYSMHAILHPYIFRNVIILTRNPSWAPGCRSLRLSLKHDWQSNQRTRAHACRHLKNSCFKIRALNSDRIRESMNVTWFSANCKSGTCSYKVEHF